MSQSSNVTRSLRRLSTVYRDEELALDGAARLQGGFERGARLESQSHRRGIFRGDLEAAIVALGGAPASGPSSSARLSGALGRARGFLAGPHVGDAYRACVHATERTATACSKALRSNLPADIRFRIECQYGEIEIDRRELRRLRWGAALTSVPPLASTPKDELGDENVLVTWSDDGGQSQTPPVLAAS